MAIFVLRYDLRSPSWAATPHPALYKECLEQVRWADANGFHVAGLAEHHGIEDGFLPSPLTMAAAVAACTTTIGISIGAALVPMHDPVRMAEQIAVVDHVSGGRASYVLGTGYRPEEFAMSGIDYAARGRLFAEHVEVMRKAWTGEPFEWRGRTIRVTPRPLSQPHPVLFAGGSGPLAAKRAARLGLNFLPASGDPELQRVYQEECERLGFPGFCIAPNGPGVVIVSKDPDKTWDDIARYALYDAQTYRSWQHHGTHSQVLSQADDLDDLKREGVYRVVTPDECVALADELGPAGGVILHPLMCGMPAQIGWESLELVRNEVMPRVST